MNNNKIIIMEALKYVILDKYSIDEVRDILTEFEEVEYIENIFNELDYIEENFEDNIDLRNENIKLLIDSIENENINIIKKPSIREIKEALASMDRDKLLLENMVMITVN